MSDADSGTETERRISVNIGSTKSSTIAAFYRAVDEFYSGRSAVDVQVEGDQVDEDPDIRTDERVGSSPDEREADSQPGGGTEDTGSGSPQTELRGSEVDEGAAPDSDNAPVETSGSDVESSATERAEPESEQSEREHEHPRFHFAPLFHSRGDRID